MSSTKKKIQAIVHIGSPKTGTTTLQHALSDDRENLSQKGILYPELDGAKNHNRISLLWRNNPPMREFRQPVQTGTSLGANLSKESYYAEGEKTLSTIKQQISVGQHHTVIISAEYLFFRPTMQQMDDLSNRLNSIFDKVSIIVYLRDPISYYVAQALQTLKASEKAMAPSAPQYLSILNAFAKNFNVRVRKFDRKSLYKNDIVHDFFQVALPDHTPPDYETKNRSLSPEAAKILNMHRRIYFPNEDNVFYPHGRKLANILSRIELKVRETSKVTEKSSLKKYIQNHLWQEFSSQSDEIRSKYKIHFDKPVIEETIKNGEPPLDKKKGYAVDELFETNEEYLERLLASLSHLALGNPMKSL